MRIIKIAQSAGVVATVVDNLNSDSETDALSAKQGKLLNEKILSNSAVGDTLPIGTVVDYDGTDIPEGWELVEDNIGSVIVNSTEPEGDSRENVWIQSSKNILEPCSSSSAISSHDNNTYTFNADLSINWFEYIAIAELKANMQYTISLSTNLLYGRLALSSIPEGVPDEYASDITIENADNYDALHLLSSERTNTSATFTSNVDQVVYLRYCSDAERTNTSAFTVSIQLEQGSNATEYEPYVEINKMYVKTDNDVYQLVYEQPSIDLSNVVVKGDIAVIEISNEKSEYPEGFTKDNTVVLSLSRYENKSWYTDVVNTEDGNVYSTGQVELTDNMIYLNGVETYISYKLVIMKI